MKGPVLTLLRDMCEGGFAVTLHRRDNVWHISMKRLAYSDAPLRKVQAATMLGAVRKAHDVTLDWINEER